MSRVRLLLLILAAVTIALLPAGLFLMVLSKLL